MRKRVTLTLDEKLIMMLRHKQTQMMLDGNKQVSISTVVNKILLKSINEEKMINDELDSVFVNHNHH